MKQKIYLCTFEIVIRQLSYARLDETANRSTVRCLTPRPEADQVGLGSDSVVRGVCLKGSRIFGSGPVMSQIWGRVHGPQSRHYEGMEKVGEIRSNSESRGQTIGWARKIASSLQILISVSFEFDSGRNRPSTKPSPALWFRPALLLQCEDRLSLPLLPEGTAYDASAPSQAALITNLSL
jgi:hypothetical protein